MQAPGGEFVNSRFWGILGAFSAALCVGCAEELLWWPGFNPITAAYDIERVLNNLVYPHWQYRPFEAIRRSDIADLLDIVEDENGARQADVMLAIIRKMMNWRRRLTSGHFCR